MSAQSMEVLAIQAEQACNVVAALGDATDTAHLQLELKDASWSRCNAYLHSAEVALSMVRAILSGSSAKLAADVAADPRA